MMGTRCAYLVADEHRANMRMAHTTTSGVGS